MLPRDVTREHELWERNCRGYLVWDYHVQLEPARARLDHAPVHRSDTVIDDGRRASIWQLIGGHTDASDPASPRPLPTRPAEFRSAELTEIQLVVPPGFQVRAGLATELVASL